MPGPAPKDPSQRRRRNVTPGFRVLPAAGRAGDAPPWPLPEESEAELTLWRRLWALPQALEWERVQDYLTPALYVRAFCKATAGEKAGDPRLLAEIRQLDGLIGVSPKAMLQLRWEVEEGGRAAPVADSRDELRSRIRAVE